MHLSLCEYNPCLVENDERADVESDPLFKPGEFITSCLTIRKSGPEGGTNKLANYGADPL